jgi:hypothetical protein
MDATRHFRELVRLGLLSLCLAVSASLFALARSSPQNSAPAPSGSTDDSKSIAAAAQAAKARKAKAAKVFTDEDMEVHKSPIPVMNLEGEDNTEAVIAAIQTYKEKHKSEETEQAVRDWYDEYDAMLSSNAREASMYRSLRETNTLNGYDLCQQTNDYEHCEKRRLSELRGQRMDAAKINQNMGKVGRIQQGLMKVKQALPGMHLNYPWFRIRNGNGIGYLSW